MKTVKEKHLVVGADFAGFPSRKSFQVGGKYHDAFGLTPIYGSLCEGAGSPKG